MTIKVSTPNGATIEFPDGTDAETVQRVMRQAHGGPDDDEQSYAAGIGRTALQGLTLGFGDEAIAGAKSVLGGETYDDALKYERDKLKSFQTSHPVISTVSEIAGGVPLSFIPGLNAAGYLRGAATVGQAARRAAAVGAGYGAVSGFGTGEGGTTGEGALNRIAHAGVGAGAGAAAGYGLSRGANWLGERVGGYQAARAEAGGTADAGALRTFEKALGRDSIDPDALRGQMLPAGGRAVTPDHIAQAVERRAAGDPLADIAADIGVTPRTLQTHLNRFDELNRAPLNLVDRTRLQGPGAGENTSWTMRGAAATPGEARSEAARTLTERQVGARQRLVQDVQQNVHAGDMDAINAGMAQVRQAENAAYRAAEAQAQPLNLRPTLDAWERRFSRTVGPVGDKIRDALDLFSRKVNVVSGNGQSLIPVRNFVTSMRDFRDARQGLSQMIESTLGPHGEATPLTRELTKLRQALTRNARQTNPAWGAADDLVAARKGGQTALRMGEDLALKLNTRSRDTLAAFNKMSDPEKNLLRAGLSRNLQDILLNKPGVDMVSQLRLPGAQQILRTVLGKKEAETLLRRVAEEDAMLSTYRSLGGSQTTPLKEAIDDLRAPSRFVESVRNFDIRGAAGAAASAATERFVRGRNQSLMRMMTSDDPAAQLATLRKIGALQPARVATGRQFAQRGLFALPTLSGLAGRLSGRF